MQLGQFRLDSGQMSAIGDCAALEQITQEIGGVSILECFQDQVDKAMPNTKLATVLLQIGSWTRHLK